MRLDFDCDHRYVRLLTQLLKRYHIFKRHERTDTTNHDGPSLVPDHEYHGGSGHHNRRGSSAIAKMPDSDHHGSEKQVDDILSRALVGLWKSGSQQYAQGT